MEEQVKTKLFSQNEHDIKNCSFFELDISDELQKKNTLLGENDNIRTSILTCTILQIMLCKFGIEELIFIDIYQDGYEHISLETNLDYNMSFKELIRINNIKVQKDLFITNKSIDFNIIMTNNMIKIYYKDELIPIQKEKLNKYFKNVMFSAVKDVNVSIKDIIVLDATEYDLVVNKWNCNTFNYKSKYTVHELFERQVKCTPNKTALCTNNESISYYELNRKSNQLARYLISIGVSSGELIGVSINRTVDLVIALLAILKSGAAYLPLDSSYPINRTNFMINDSNVKYILTTSKLADNFKENTVCTIYVDTLHDKLTKLEDTNLLKNIDKNALMYIIYTSGSTGKPKGVKISHSAVVNFLNSMKSKPGINSNDTLLAVTSISFDISILELFLPLSVGAKIILANKKVTMDAYALAKWIDKYNVTIMQATPITWKILIESGWQGKVDLKVLCGGENISYKLSEQLVCRVKEVWNMYGPTEATIWCSTSQITSNNIINIGHPIQNTQFYILNSHQEPVPVGFPGELYIGGHGLFSGYLNRRELTNSRLIDNKYSKYFSGKLYRTGDLVKYLSNGEVEFIRRIDQQVKVNGHRIELGEIEAILLNNICIKDSIVLVDELNGNKILISYIITNNKYKTSINDIRTYLMKYLPHYMIPSKIIFLKEFPLTANGKIDKNELLKNKDKNESFQGVGNPIEPQNYIEKTFCDLCTKILGINKIGINDNFIGLGGDSLKANLLCGELRNTGITLLPSDVLKYQIISKLISISVAENYVDKKKVKANNIREFLDSNDMEKVEGIVKKNISKHCFIRKIFPISQIQRKMLLNNILYKDSPAYIEQISFNINGQFDNRLCEAAIDILYKICYRLRTIYMLFSVKIPIQVILNDIKPNFKYIDLIDANDSFIIQKKLIKKERNKKINFNKQVPFSVILVRHKSNFYSLIWTYHHVVLDGVSFNSLLKKFFEIYCILNQNNEFPIKRELELENDNIQLQEDYAIEHIKMPSQTVINYWNNKIKGYNSELRIEQFKYSKNEKNKFNNTSIIIKKTTLQKFCSICKNLNITLNIGLQSIWTMTLRDHENLSDILFGTVVSDKWKYFAEQNDTYGVFINIIPTRIKLNKETDFEQIANSFQKDFVEALDVGFIDLDDISLCRNFIDCILIYNSETPESLLRRSKILNKLNIECNNWETHEVTNYDLTLIFNCGDYLEVKVCFNEIRYSKNHLDELLRKFVNLVNNVVEIYG